MIITICGSIVFSSEMIEIASQLEKMGYKVNLPTTTKTIRETNLTVDDIKKEKQTGEFVNRVIRIDAIREYYQTIRDSDAILVLNYDKNDTENYIGGNTFLEIGFAHVLNKKIFLFNDVPQMSYTDEINVIRPIVIYGDLSKLTL